MVYCAIECANGNSVPDVEARRGYHLGFGVAGETLDLDPGDLDHPILRCLA
jgi:hypothetical protein